MAETTIRWHVNDDDPDQYYLASNIPESRVFTLPGNRYSLCDYLNALEDAAAMLPQSSWHMNEYGVLSAEEEAMLARLKALRDA